MSDVIGWVVAMLLALGGVVLCVQLSGWGFHRFYYFGENWGLAPAVVGYLVGGWLLVLVLYLISEAVVYYQGGA